MKLQTSFFDVEYLENWPISVVHSTRNSVRHDRLAEPHNKNIRVKAKAGHDRLQMATPLIRHFSGVNRKPAIKIASTSDVTETIARTAYIRSELDKRIGPAHGSLKVSHTLPNTYPLITFV